MAGRIEDYAIIGDMRTAAPVCRDGSIDWPCLPRFDSAACFAALLGKPENGRWMIAPNGAFKSRRRYRENTLITVPWVSRADAETLLSRLLKICNDVGLLAEEYDPRARRRLTVDRSRFAGRGGQ
jgi:GH15 family glucan-1,4-alpha-glucosidase